MSRLVLVEQYEAMGGPEHSGTADDGYEAGPTEAGEYRIAYCGRHVSRRYPFWSRVPWGSPVKDEAGEIWVKVKRSWEKLTKYSPATRENILSRHESLYRTRIIPTTWVFNDFGHMTCYLYKDTNRDGKMSPGEKIHGEFLHTTPDNEAQTTLTKPVVLQPSHGCVHIKPVDIDDMIARRFMAKNSKVIVHDYRTQAPLLPFGPRARGTLELHFYPRSNRIYVVNRTAL